MQKIATFHYYFSNYSNFRLHLRILIRLGFYWQHLYPLFEMEKSRRIASAIAGCYGPTFSEKKSLLFLPLLLLVGALGKQVKRIKMQICAFLLLFTFCCDLCGLLAAVSQFSCGRGRENRKIGQSAARCNLFYAE